MKKVTSLILALSMVAVFVAIPVSALPPADKMVYMAFDAYELKNGSTPWSFQHALIKQTNYADLEFIESGWFYEYYQNWTQGAFPYAYTGEGGKSIDMHAGMVCDPVLTFTAPRSGNVQIPSFVVEKKQDTGDGINFQIVKNDMIIFPQDSDWYKSETVQFKLNTPDIFLTVKEGDKIFFRVNMRETQNSDGVMIMDYQIKYLSEEAYLNGQNRKDAIVINKEPYKEAVKIEVNFIDVNDHWGKDYILPLAQAGIIKGKTATTFEPDSNITRAEFLTLALKVAGIDAVAGETYADVAGDAWFANTVATAKAKGFIDANMVADGNFYPDQNITREEMTSVIVKVYEGMKTAAQAGDVTIFSDNASFSAWATESIGKAVALGVVTGNPDGTFSALGNATRAEAAVIFSRLLKLL